MSVYIEPLAKLVNAFSKLPGIGGKTALRLAYHTIKAPEGDINELVEALTQIRQKIKYCSCCGNFCEGETCEICSDTRRDKSVICVVKDPRDVIAMEKTGSFKGVYHVLHGVISPLDGVGPEKLKIRELLARLSDSSVREVIMATDPTVEGEATASYISRLVKPMGIKITRLAYGVPVGANLEYADTVTLQRALEGRNEI